MEAWQWILLGTVILGAETIVDSEFYLVFIGLAAIAVGFQDVAPFDLPPSGQWLLFSGLAVSSIVLFRQRVYDRIRGDAAEVDEGVDGELAIAWEEIAPGETGLVELRGARWSARNAAPNTIAVRSRVRVDHSDGLTLVILPEHESAL
jgi:membrane protein implicated in regulation of membrane protease activity